GPLAEALTDALAQLGMPVLERRRDERAFARGVTGRADAKGPGDLFSLDHGSSKGERRRASLKRSLEKALGSELTVDDRGHDPAALEQFLDLEASGWKGDASRGGHALRITGDDAWFADVASAFRADGRLTVLTVTGGGVVVYMGVSLRVGDGMFGCLDAYDERFATYRVGSMGRIAGWRRALSHMQLRFFDPNLGSFYVDSTLLFPHRRPHVTLLVATGGVFSRTLVREIPRLRRLRGAIRTR
ncbi:MAG: GNAT family N-acetyltransferase, partial [Demequinaceae bacterium]|nr:GNAT family N-acetyltransferase [Demequinaceae bacterium]